MNQKDKEDLNTAFNIIKCNYPNNKILIDILEKYSSDDEINKELYELLRFLSSSTPIYESNHFYVDNLSLLLMSLKLEKKYSGISGYFPLNIVNKEVIFNSTIIGADLIEGFKFPDTLGDIFNKATLYLILKVPINKEQINEFISSEEVRYKFQKSSVDCRYIEIPIKKYYKSNKTEHLVILPGYDYKIKLDINNKFFDDNLFNKLQLILKTIFLLPDKRSFYFNSQKIKNALQKIDSTLIKAAIEM